MIDYDYIRDHITEEDALCQIAEEAAELAQAALKCRRTITDTNPTPVSPWEAKAKLLEEIADVWVTLDVLIKEHRDEMEIAKRKLEKAHRWADRLRAKEMHHETN